MEKILKYLKTGKSIEDMATYLKSDEKDIKELLIGLQLRGYQIDLFVENGKAMARYNPNPQEIAYNWKLNETTNKPKKMIVTSDHHSSSKYANPHLVEEMYECAEKRGIKTVINCGDMTEGYYQNRPGHIYEIYDIGATEQVERLIEEYPKVNGIKTYFILGNHDHTHVKNGGTDIGKIISKARKDMIYMGFDRATLEYNKTKIQLYHPQRGPAYALSYPNQKYIDAMPGGEKPHVLCVGHYHTSFYMLYRNIHTFNVPSLQSPTPYVIGKGLGGIMGYWILEFENDKDGNIVYMNSELKQYHNKSRDKVLVKKR